MRLPFATDRLFGGPGSTRPVCVMVGHPGGASPLGPACRAVRAFIHPDAPGLTRASQGLRFDPLSAVGPEFVPWVSWRATRSELESEVFGSGDWLCGARSWESPG